MTTNYDKYPELRIQNLDEHRFSGWKAICGQLKERLEALPAGKKVLVVECYQGVSDDELIPALLKGLQPITFINTHELMLSPDAVEALTQPDVSYDRIFGFLTRLNMEDFLNPEKVAHARKEIDSSSEGLILVYGPGAALVEANPSILVYADMARWEIQLRMRRHETHNLGLQNAHENIETQYKRGYFVDWRVCDRLKKKLMQRWDYLLDTNRAHDPVMITGHAFQASMQEAVSRPFSVVPYFDAGPWGGQWMKEKLGLDPSMPNYAWCFNCVPEENSLYLRFGGARFEMPSINLVFARPKELLGEPVHARFGAEFPIRFDFLDTMSGGNLSLQVHPLTEYIHEHFGIPYTQDESYYLMDAGPDARVYLGLQEGIRGEAMIQDLQKAQAEGSAFDDDRFVKSWPARKHDHFLIPGGTIHCSGSNSMVLEISSTPYIFTFKLWDWGRMGLDGKPRPINIDRGAANIQWNRTESWVKDNLVNQVEKVSEGEGWREERTGLHEREFIETRRHWFTGSVPHHTGGGVNVLSLVEGEQVTVESPSGAFEPFKVHYAEVFIMPAAVGEYSIRPSGPSEGKECATIKAFIRFNA